MTETVNQEANEDMKIMALKTLVELTEPVSAVPHYFSIERIENYAQKIFEKKFSPEGGQLESWLYQLDAEGVISSATISTDIEVRNFVHTPATRGQGRRTPPSRRIREVVGYRANLTEAKRKYGDKMPTICRF